MAVCKSFAVDGNITWNYLTVGKQMINIKLNY